MATGKTARKIVVATLEDVPVTARLLDTVLEVPADARRWVHVLCTPDDEPLIVRAIGKGKYISDEHAPNMDERLIGDVRALHNVLRYLFTPDGSPFAGVWPTGVVLTELDAAATTALFEKAKFEVIAYRDILQAHTVREDETTAFDRAIAPFREHFTPPVADAAEGYLRGATTAVPEQLLSAESDYYGANLADVVSDALSGEVERWHPGISGRLLDLWIAMRKPEKTDLSIGLGQDMQAELGAHRARLFADALEQRGLHPAIATLVGASCSGESTWFLPVTLFARPDVLASAVEVDRKVARALAKSMIGKMGLEAAPSMRARYEGLLDSGSAALGTEALLELVDVNAPSITRAHLERAAVGCELTELLKLGAALEAAAPEAHVGTKRFVNELWLRANAPDEVASELKRALERDADVVDADAAWERIVSLLEEGGAAAFPAAHAQMGSMGFSDLTSVIENLAKPSASMQRRIVALCAEKQKELGGLHRALVRRAGTPKKLGPPPYEPKDLEGLPAPLAKAWKTAREKSWKAGVKLPRGATTKSLDAAAKTLGAPLPADVRSFYLLHDGAGDDECFRSCRLYSMREAVARRQELLTIEGAPFDAAWLPLTDDGAGNHHCVVLKGKKAGSIVDFDHETGGGDVLAKNFAAFVQSADWE